MSINSDSEDYEHAQIHFAYTLEDFDARLRSDDETQELSTMLSMITQGLSSDFETAGQTGQDQFELPNLLRNVQYGPQNKIMYGSGQMRKIAFKGLLNMSGAEDNLSGKDKQMQYIEKFITQKNAMELELINEYMNKNTDEKIKIDLTDENQQFKKKIAEKKKTKQQKTSSNQIKGNKNDKNNKKSSKNQKSREQQDDNSMQDDDNSNSEKHISVPQTVNKAKRSHQRKVSIDTDQNKQQKSKVDIKQRQQIREKNKEQEIQLNQIKSSSSVLANDIFSAILKIPEHSEDGDTKQLVEVAQIEQILENNAILSKPNEKNQLRKGIVNQAAIEKLLRIFINAKNAAEKYKKQQKVSEIYSQTALMAAGALVFLFKGEEVPKNIRAALSYLWAAVDKEEGGNQQIALRALAGVSMNSQNLRMIENELNNLTRKIFFLLEHLHTTNLENALYFGRNLFTVELRQREIFFALSPFPVVSDILDELLAQQDVDYKDQDQEEEEEEEEEVTIEPEPENKKKVKKLSLNRRIIQSNAQKKPSSTLLAVLQMLNSLLSTSNGPWEAGLIASGLQDNIANVLNIYDPTTQEFQFASNLVSAIFRKKSQGVEPKFISKLSECLSGALFLEGFGDLEDLLFNSSKRILDISKQFENRKTNRNQEQQGLAVQIIQDTAPFELHQIFSEFQSSGVLESLDQLSFSSASYTWNNISKMCQELISKLIR